MTSVVPMPFLARGGGGENHPTEDYYTTDDDDYDYFEEEIVDEDDDDESVVVEEVLLENDGIHEDHDLYEEVTVGEDEISFDEEAISLDEEIVELSDDDLDGGGENGRSRSNDFADDASSVALASVDSMPLNDGYDYGCGFRRGMKKEDKIQMEMHESAISQGARKAMLEEIERERRLLELETVKLRREVVSDESAEELQYWIRERCQLARDRLLHEIKKIDEVLSSSRDTKNQSRPQPVDVEKKKKALAELRRQAAREELARNNSRLKAAFRPGGCRSQNSPLGSQNNRSPFTSIITSASAGSTSGSLATLSSVQNKLSSPDLNDDDEASLQTNEEDKPSIAEHRNPAIPELYMTSPSEQQSEQERLQEETGTKEKRTEEPAAQPSCHAQSTTFEILAHKTADNIGDSILCFPQASALSLEESKPERMKGSEKRTQGTTDGQDPPDTSSTIQNGKEITDNLEHMASNESDNSAVQFFRKDSTKSLIKTFDSPKPPPAPLNMTKPHSPKSVAGQVPIPSVYQNSPNHLQKGIPLPSRELPTQDMAPAKQNGRRSPIKLKIAKQGPADVPSLFRAGKVVTTTKSSKEEPKPMVPSSSVDIDSIKDNSNCEFHSLSDLQRGNIEGIDITCREQYLSPLDFQEHFQMTKSEFSKLPKWKRDKMKRTLKLF